MERLRNEVKDIATSELERVNEKFPLFNLWNEVRGIASVKGCGRYFPKVATHVDFYKKRLMMQR